MSSPGDNANGRRASTAGRASIDSTDSDIYDYAANAVSDGFRPNRNAARSSVTRRPAPPPPLLPPPPIASPGISKVNGVVNRPSSTAKPPRPHDSLTIRNDGGDSSSTAQPSHPYALYTQRASTGTATDATESSPSRNTRTSYQGPRDPAHPYALYTQNTANQDEPTQQQQIPVGFGSGTAANYRRRVGPDGEEVGDLVGPLGHTEELPPYTRYPEVSVTAKPPAQTTATSRLSQRRSRTHQSPLAPVSNRSISGAGGMGMATRNPEFSSTEETLAMSPTRLSIQSSHHSINVAAREYSEKPKQGKWETRARKKLFGIIPYWSICLLFSGMVIMGIVMGAVIGTMIKHNSQANTTQPDADKPPTATTTIIMVQPLQTPPPGLSPLETGAYLLPPLDSTSSSTSCIADTKKSPAWSCEMLTRFYWMNISQDDHDNDTDCYNLTLKSVPLAPSKYIWGTQPPDLETPTRLSLVNDTFTDGRGPAWWSSIKYDKTVVLREGALSFSSNVKRWDYPGLNAAAPDLAHYSRKRPTAQDGENVWVCTWPGTTMEIFIYPNVNASAATPTSDLNPLTPTASGSGDPATSGYDDSEAETGWKPYPRAVKFLERRMPHGSDEAKCRKMKISNNGHQIEPVCDPVSGAPIELDVPEKPFDLQGNVAMEHPHWPNRRGLQVARSSVEVTPCNCLWWSS